jgi:hypothetical protein
VHPMPRRLPQGLSHERATTTGSGSTKRYHARSLPTFKIGHGVVTRRSVGSTATPLRSRNAPDLPACAYRDEGHRTGRASSVDPAGAAISQAGGSSSVSARRRPRRRPQVRDRRAGRRARCWESRRRR